MDYWVRRLLTWICAVAKHSYTLVGTIVGSTFVALLPWIVSQLPASMSEPLTLARSTTPNIYHLMASVIFFIGLLYASFLAWNEDRDLLEASITRAHSAEQTLLDTTRPQFVAEIPELFITGDHQNADLIKLYVPLVVLNRGADSAIDRWTLKVVPPHPATPFIQTEKGLSESREGPGGKLGGNLLHDREVIIRNGSKRRLASLSRPKEFTRIHNWPRTCGKGVV